MIEQEHILVTGGAGMIGSNLVKRLVFDGYRVSVVDNLWRGKQEYLKDRYGSFVIDMDNDFHLTDLSIPDTFDHLFNGVDYVYHLADVVAGIDYVFKNQGDLFRHNLMINSNVVDTIKKHSIKGYIYVGTACSFPAELQTGVDAAPLKEEDQYPANPESAYGWSKLMGEYEAFLLARETQIPVSVLTFHNVYGAPCDFDIERSQVIPALIRKAIRYPEEDFIVWGSGTQGRAFVHVDDIVEALVLAKNKGLGQGLIQIGPDHCTSIREIAETVVKVSGKSIDVVYDTTKPEGDKGRCADYAKARNVLGWEPKIDLMKGLEGLYGWIENKMNGHHSGGDNGNQCDFGIPGRSEA